MKFHNRELTVKRHQEFNFLEKLLARSSRFVLPEQVCVLTAQPGVDLREAQLAISNPSGRC